MLATAFKDIGLNNGLSRRSADVFKLRGNEKVIIAVDTNLKGSLKELDLLIAHPNRPKTATIGNGVAIESLIVTDRRIIGLQKQQFFLRSQTKNMDSDIEILEQALCLNVIPERYFLVLLGIW